MSAMFTLPNAARGVLIAGLLACVGMVSYPTVAQGQSSASPYTTGYRWDANSRLVGAISPDPDGTGPLPFPAVRYTYDADGLLIKTEKGTLATWAPDTVLPANWSGFTVQQTLLATYDAVGNTLEQRGLGSDGSVQTVTQTSYDEDDRPYCVATRMNMAAVPALPTAYNKTFACALGTVGNFGQDRITKTIYDAAGHTAQIRKAIGTSSEQAYVTYIYTLSGNQKFVIDANGNRARYGYDVYDRQIQWLFPSPTLPAAFDPSTPATAGATAGALNTADYEQYGLDANGNRTSLRKRDGQVITYTYDALDRVTAKDLPGTASDTATSYDLLGRLLTTRFTTSGEGISNTYDNAARLTSSVNTMGGVSRALGYLYDPDDNRVRVTHPDTTYFTYDYDGLDRATIIRENGTTQIANTTYDAQGRRAGRTRGAVATTYAYDPVSRPYSIFDNLSGTASDVTATFGYSPASQIATRGRDNDVYTFGGADLVNLSRSYMKNGLNQYELAGPATFCYDPNGNLTLGGPTGGATAYKYDTENRLIEAHTAASTACPAVDYSGALTAALAWDPMGRLFQTSGGSAGMTQFLYDGDELVAEYSGSGALLRRYVHGTSDDDPILWYEGSALGDKRSLQADYQGSIISVGDGSGASLHINTYDEYGIPGSGNLGRFQYTGQAWIPELAMYYYKARIYSPTLGRFLQVDPIGYKDQLNLYAYVGNDPVDGRDSSGLQAKPKPPQIPKSPPRPRKPPPAANDNDITIRSGGGGSLLNAILSIVGAEVAAVADELDPSKRKYTLYRGLSRRDVKNLERHHAILAYDPDADATPEETAHNSRISQYIPFTRSYERAVGYATKGRHPGGYVVSIDGQSAMMAGRIVEHDTTDYDPTVAGYVAADQEVLVRGPVPVSALTGMQKVEPKGRR